jgi:hypothetical protein
VEGLVPEYAVPPRPAPTHSHGTSAKLSVIRPCASTVSRTYRYRAEALVVLSHDRLRHRAIVDLLAGVQDHFSIHARVERVPQRLGDELREALKEVVDAVVVAVSVVIVRRDASFVGERAGLQKVPGALHVVPAFCCLVFEQLYLEVGQQAVEIAAGEGQAAHGVHGDNVGSAAVVGLHQSHMPYTTDIRTLSAWQVNH